MGTQIKDVVIKPDAPNTLLLEKHADYIAAYGSKKDDYEYTLSEYLRMSGIYWGLTVMDLMSQLHRMNRDEIIDFIKASQHECGGISASVGHDPHLLYTLSAVQGRLDAVDVDKAVQFVLSCMNFDGGFGCRPGSESHAGQIYCCTGFLSITGQLQQVNADLLGWWLCERQLPSGGLNGRPEKVRHPHTLTDFITSLPTFIYTVGIESLGTPGEIDTRFSFCAVATLALLGRLDAVDVDKAVQFVLSCMNFDGGFGCRPGSESHAGQIYCCTGFLSITGQLQQVNADLLGWWLCERQLPSGGLNGRPEKLPDVCYSWWVLAALKIISRIHWIDKAKLRTFILACQDEETGGFADRPGDMVDPFHTLFGVAGLSLLGDEQIKAVNPVFCMPEEVLQRIGLHTDLLT
ncbi:hypothetical protein PGIGA_G00060070 [Pangasianodon gigas]|uniref:Uncharacterized protein n=1 Tax=Pangasianodon gigas TaxID=30993 RepID=A0ACC5X4S5_PANGG|nr:hypothetical protein [Pangasianodon gigas]